MEVTYTPPKLTINGKPYAVLRSDAEIMQDVAEIDAAFNVLAENNLPQALQDKDKSLYGYLDRLLGVGAGDKIAASIKGLPKERGLGVAASIKISEGIIARAGRAYAKAFELKYGDDE